MRALLQLILKSLWPVRSNAPSRSTSTDAYLKPLFILMIALLAGPDIFAATELTTILELVGAAMFLLAFGVGVELLGLAAFEWLRRVLLPVDYVTLIRLRGKPSSMIYGALLICRHGLVLVCLGVGLKAGVHGALSILQS
jgi:hypothetical protein